MTFTKRLTLLTNAQLCQMLNAAIRKFDILVIIGCLLEMHRRPHTFTAEDLGWG